MDSVHTYPNLIRKLRRHPIHHGDSFIIAWVWVFVVWKTVIKNGQKVEKGRPVVDLRDLNKIAEPGA